MGNSKVVPIRSETEEGRKRKDNAEEQPHPFEEAGTWSKLTGAWILPLFLKGYRRPIEKDDMYKILKEETSEELGNHLSRFWEEEILVAGMVGRKPSYIRALLKAFGRRYFLSGIIFFGNCFFLIGQPICLGGLIRYFNEEPGYNEDYVGILFALGIILGSFFCIATYHSYAWFTEQIGMRVRIASCSLLYRKALKLSSMALSQTNVGQMVNLLSNDVSRFDGGLFYSHYLWVAPLQAFVVTILLWHELGPSSMAGIVILILMVPLQGYMGGLFSRLRLAIALKTDERIGIMDEIINAIRVIKMYAWEKSFTTKIKEARKKEIEIIMKTFYHRAFQVSFYFHSSKIIFFLAFLTYVLTGNLLTAEKVYVMSALINNLRYSMTLVFPFAVLNCSEMYISCNRIQKFLEMDEKQHSKHIDKSSLRSVPNICSLMLSQVTARWSTSSHNYTLKNVSFDAKAGQLVVIIGAVGSGKSSLFNAILGELPIKYGSIKIRGKLGYVSQENWLVSGTVKQNILFGLPFEEKKYHDVLQVCNLVRDLSTFPNGDQTMVGERGSTLSGGQKARINLARTIYFDADIYLMDDPLSAVDAQVGKALYDKCISEFLAGKIRILVTHQVHHIKTADHIILLKNGEVAAQGTYAQLIEHGINFAELIGNKHLDNHQHSYLHLSPSDKKEDAAFEKDFSVYERNVQRQSSSHNKNCSNLESMGLKVSDAENLEIKSTGSVGLRTYGNYFSAGGGPVFIYALTILSIITQTLYAGSDYWLYLWVRHERTRSASNYSLYEVKRQTLTSNAVFIGNTSESNERPTFIYIYTGMSVLLFISSLTYSFLSFKFFLNASQSLHMKMFKSIIEAPIAFFDTHSKGQILNRFTKDLGQIDTLLPAALFYYITVILMTLGVVVIIAVVNFWTLIPTAFLAMVFYLLRRFYLSTTRDLKRLDGITRSPVFSHLSSSLQGLTTIRALGAQDVFIKDFDDHQDLHSRAWCIALYAGRYFAVWLDALSSLYVAIVTCSIFASKDVLSGSDAGLAISSVMMLTVILQWGVRQSIEVENHMTSVERVLEYSKLEPEPLQKNITDRKHAEWPGAGSLSFQNVYLYYETTGPPVLDNISFTITAGQKIGIVGRTGAGKSSLISCLFRLTQPRGTILIDDVDTASIPLSDLRESISIIPQDPTLFNGTVRQNLDPFSCYSDDAIWKALEEVQLKSTVSEMSGGLSGFISEGGGNLSVGQKQLICLARAILKNNKILVMDEATANVDPQTDKCIQQAIRTKFANNTVLTIAHRLHTIMGCDKVLVMEAGRVEEFATPFELLKDENTWFFSLSRHDGSVTEQYLRK